MRLIKLTTLEKKDIAIVADDVVSIEKDDYDWDWEKKYDFAGRPTIIIMKHYSYSVREDFETVCALVEGTGNEKSV